MKITGAYHNQHSVKVHYLQDDVWLKLLFPRLAWEEESGRKTPAKEPKQLNSNTDTCRNTAHTVRMRAFSSFPFNLSFALFSGLDSYRFMEFPWPTSIFSFLTASAFPHFLSACFRFPPPKCCFKTLLIKVTALWFFASSWTCFHFYLMLFHISMHHKSKSSKYYLVWRPK